MTTRWWGMMRIVLTMLSLTMLVGLAGLASAQESDTKASCKQDGWEEMTTTEGDAFNNQGDCVSYVAADDGVPVSLPSPNISLTSSWSSTYGSCHWQIRASNLDLDTAYSYSVYINGEYYDTWQIPANADYRDWNDPTSIATGLFAGNIDSKGQVTLYVGLNSSTRTFVAESEIVSCSAEG